MGGRYLRDLRALINDQFSRARSMEAIVKYSVVPFDDRKRSPSCSSIATDNVGADGFQYHRTDRSRNH